MPPIAAANLFKENDVNADFLRGLIINLDFQIRIHLFTY